MVEYIALDSQSTTACWKWRTPAPATAARRALSTRPDVNRTLKWAFAEAGNSVAVNHARQPQRHVSRLYARLRRQKGHSRTVGAMARHLAEAAWWVLSKQEPYRERCHR